MTESAESPRERRRLETERALIRAARALTAAEGLHAFTIEQVCESAGVSRRTFFNYFASKEDAVLGIPLHFGNAEAEEAFVAAGDPSASGLSATLLDDLVALSIRRWTAMDVARESIDELHAAVEREPRLFGRALAHMAQTERADAALVERREGLAPGDLRAILAAQVIGTLTRSAAEAYFSGDAVVAVADLFTARLTAVREILTTQTTQPEGPA